MRGRTTFIIAHRVQSLMRADLILVFDAGRIVERGTHESLLRADGMYRRVFELQTRIETELTEEVSRV
jgi:ATP-binding cassette subfamily B protein